MERLRSTDYATWEQRADFEEQWRRVKSPEQLREISLAEERLVEALAYLGSYKHELENKAAESRRREMQVREDEKLARELQTSFRVEEYGVLLPVLHVLSYTPVWTFPDEV